MMRRPAAILLLLLALGTALRAQTLVLPEHAVGVEGGVTLSWLQSSPSISQPSPPVGAHIGLQYRFIAEKYFGLHLQLNYDQRGFRDRRDDGTSIRRQMDYIELPMMAHFTFGRRVFRFYFELGPTIAVLVHDYGRHEDELPQHALNVAHHFDWGLTGGLGIEFNTRAGIYTLAGRYSYGFGNIFRERRTEFIQSSNQNVAITVGFMWKIPPRNGGYHAYPPKPAKAAKKAQNPQ